MPGKKRKLSGPKEVWMRPARIVELAEEKDVSILDPSPATRFEDHNVGDVAVKRRLDILEPGLGSTAGLCPARQP